MQSNIFLLLVITILTYHHVSADSQPSTDGDQAVVRANDALSKLMSVNVPIFYDMVKNGSSMGLNVLSGLVKVERGEEAERNGLVGNGRRPLSVRIFGVPVFERGVRVRPPSSSGPILPGASNSRGGEEDASDEALPI